MEHLKRMYSANIISHYEGKRVYYRYANEDFHILTPIHSHYASLLNKDAIDSVEMTLRIKSDKMSFFECFKLDNGYNIQQSDDKYTIVKTMMYPNEDPDNHRWFGRDYKRQLCLGNVKISYQI